VEKSSLFVIRRANGEDISSIVSLSDQKRRFYEKANPQFWKRAENANELQRQWFTTILDNPNYFIYVADNKTQIDGFIIGQNINAPAVYNPGGMTLMIDDFCVASPELWETVGYKLLITVSNEGKKNGAVQVLIVSGFHDQEKGLFLKKQGLYVVSEWYVKQI